MHTKMLGEPGGKIGASARNLSVGGRTGLIDCGAAFEGFGRTKKNIAPSGNFLRGTYVDFLILTHGHADHSGFVAPFLELHPETRAMMTDETFRLACIIACDTVKIARHEARRARQRGDAHIPVSPISQNALDLFLSGKQVELVKNGEWVKPWPGWNIGFYSAGHIKGASSYFIDAAGDRPIYGTGDISSVNQLTIPGVMTPPNEFLQGFFEEKGLVMITEATNGAREALRSLQEEGNEFVAQVKSVIERSGVVLIPSFAIGKIADAAEWLLRAGIIPYVDGMARETMKVEAPDVLARVKVVPAFERWEEGEAFRKEIATTPGNVILAPSGSLEGGTSVAYAKHVLPERENAVIFIGHIFDKSVSEKLAKIERGHTILLPDFKEENGVPVNVRCDVFRYDFTKHDYRSALAERVCRVKPETLIVHHVGETNGVDGFASLSEKIREMMGDNAPFMMRDTHMRGVEFPSHDGGGCCDE